MANLSEYRQYTVSWSIDVDAPSPEAAAEQVRWEYFRGDIETANVFEVATFDEDRGVGVTVVEVKQASTVRRADDAGRTGGADGAQPRTTGLGMGIALKGQSARNLAGSD